ncbi:hypothetical protein R5W24_000163 [Gemmata sp. JC717]|uniref:hypothetical protein n=1 Tax=Gemmata algarum TaxID=2975278 RepID=UPI0021BAA8E9|nr:hypothetical protein [Gemmata algarum]MDY3551089.1 hypothetical protein [Gemmata algarum]
MQAAPAALAPTVVGDSTPTQGEQLSGTKYVVLKDDKIIEGAVTLRGDVVVVRQGALDRPFGKGQVQFVANNKDEVYKFQLAKVPATDAVARLKVARWCMFSGLREQALAEAREVQQLQPANADAAALVRSLELSLQQFPPAGAVRMSPPASPNLPTELSARPTSPTGPNDCDPDLPPEAIKLFATKVQPILANQCAECHAKSSIVGAFKMARVDPANATPKATRANLWTVAGQLRKDDPAASPLLLKSLQAHGGQRAPSFATRQAVAYRTLEAWVAMAVAKPAAAVPVVPNVFAPTATVPVAPAPALPPAGVPAVETSLPPAGPAIVPAPTTPVAPSVPAPGVPTVPVPSVDPVVPPAIPSVPPEARTAPALPSAPAVPPVPSLPATPAIPGTPSIPATAPLPPTVPPAAPALPKPPVLPAAPPIPPASGFGEASTPKPGGPAGGDEFDPAGFNQPKK